jgi:hypothetical protein
MSLYADDINTLMGQKEEILPLKVETVMKQ